MWKLYSLSDPKFLFSSSSKLSDLFGNIAHTEKENLEKKRISHCIFFISRLVEKERKFRFLKLFGARQKKRGRVSDKEEKARKEEKKERKIKTEKDREKECMKES